MSSDPRSAMRCLRMRSPVVEAVDNFHLRRLKGRNVSRIQSPTVHIRGMILPACALTGFGSMRVIASGVSKVARLESLPPKLHRQTCPTSIRRRSPTQFQTHTEGSLVETEGSLVEAVAAGIPNGQSFHEAS